MARTTSPPLVEHTHLLPDHAAEMITVGSAVWYAWLEDATSFVFRSPRGTFTAYKERRGPAQEYWKAYRRRAGRLQRVYLGKSGELTPDRLDAAAAELASKPSADAPAADPAILEPALVDLLEPVARAGSAAGIQEGHRGIPEPSLPYTASDPATLDDARPLHLLATKLAIPTSRVSLVPRPRLAAQIDLAIAQRHKLILIAAPAGFGKTTIVAEWLAARSSEFNVKSSELGHAQTTQNSKLKTHNWQVAWLALDDADNQLGQFLAYLIAALETVRPQIGAAAWALLRSHAAQPPAHAILTSLLNALAALAEQIVLVLDDYHTITLQAIHEAISSLLDRMPAHMHIIITTRADPPLPLARLRARGQFTELRAADLRFTGGETAHLFDHIHGIALMPEAVAALEARTEGWAAGLQLAALSLQQRDSADLPAFLADFTGSHTYVFDYLADEVFRRQPEHVRAFLLQTAILDRLCGPLCDAVIGNWELGTGDQTSDSHFPIPNSKSQILIEELEHANMFLIRLDSNRRWYRYHHLFRDFLREQLQRALGPNDRAGLFRRASAWFEQQGLVDEAIEYALSVPAWADALRCMTSLMASQRFYEYYLDWPRWLAALPDATLAAEPDLCRRLAWILIFTGHVEAADRPLSLAETVWRAAGNQAKVGELLGLRAIAWGWKGNFVRAIQAAQQSLALLPAEAVDRQGVPAYVLGASDLHLGHVGRATDWLIAASVVTQHESAGAPNPSETFLSLAAAASLARAHQLRGDLHHAANLYRDVIRRMGSTLYLQVPSALIYFGSLCYEWNDLAEAERLLREGIAVTERIGRGRYWPGAWGLLARVLVAAGDLPQARALAGHALELARALDNPPDIAQADMLQVWLWLAESDLAAALRWLHMRTLPPDLPLSYTEQNEYLMYARISIAQAHQTPESVDLSAVIRLLNSLLRQAESDQRMADRIAILTLLALAHAHLNASGQALALLVAAIQLAEPDGYLRIFVDEGASLCELLHVLRAQLPALAPDTRLSAYLERLLAAFHSSAAPTPTILLPDSLLSQREYAVLQLIAEGQSIPEIAATLVISAHTARTHVKHIYTKLDAHNRVQALDRARTLQLL